MKKCFKCNETKELGEFYVHKQMADGHLNKCKSCTKKDTKKRFDHKIETDPHFAQSERDRGREKYHRLGYREIHKPDYETKKRIIKKYRESYPEKYQAKNASQGIGKIDSKNELHHWSYCEAHWKDVIELSVEDHNLLHRYITYDQDWMMYRRIDNMHLLESKQSHVDLLVSLKQN